MAKDTLRAGGGEFSETRTNEIRAFVALQEQVDRERERRIDEHRAAVRSGVLRKRRGTPHRLNILAEGDLWFDYPFSWDVIDWIKARAAVRPEILNLAHFGDMSTDMLGVTQRRRIADHLANPADGRFDAMLFSAGGNDLVGDLFCLWLKDAYPGLAPKYGIDRPRLAHIMGVVEAAYVDLIRIRKSIDEECVLFVHAYDFPFPDGRGVAAKDRGSSHLSIFEAGPIRLPPNKSSRRSFWHSTRCW